MCVCVCVCVCVCMCVCVCVCVCVCTRLPSLSVHLSVYWYFPLNLSTHLSVYPYVHSSIHTYISIHICLFVQLPVRACNASVYLSMHSNYLSFRPSVRLFLRPSASRVMREALHHYNNTVPLHSTGIRNGEATVLTHNPAVKRVWYLLIDSERLNFVAVQVLLSRIHLLGDVAVCDWVSWCHLVS